jgi:hypothetical protein
MELAAGLGGQWPRPGFSHGFIPSLDWSLNAQNPTLMLRWALIFLVLFIGGCGTPSAPHSAYPVTYSIQVDNTPAHSDTSPQNPNLSPTQDVAVVSGQLLYYQVVSLVDVTVYFYGMEGEGQRVFLDQAQGRTFASSVTPNTNALEFVFVATQPNSSATLKFTLSDQPIALVAAP